MTKRHPVMSMTDTVKIDAAIHAAIDELNLALPADRRLDKEPATALIGEDGRLESLDLINFVVATEQQIEDALGVSVALSALVAEGDTARFATIGSFAEAVRSMVEEASRGV